MSYELRIYSAREPILRRKLAREFRLRILPDAFRWELRFLTLSGRLPSSDGPLRTGTVVAWPAASPHHRELDRLLASGDRTVRDVEYAKNRIAAVEVTVLGRRSREWRDVASLDEVPEQHQRAVTESRTCYHLETHARRNRLSETFQLVLWKMLGVQEYALLEDPQKGTYEDVGAKIRADDERDRRRRKRRPG